MRPFMNDVTHLEGGGASAKRWRYSISLFSKMSDKGEGGVKNLKKWETSFTEIQVLGNPSLSTILTT